MKHFISLVVSLMLTLNLSSVLAGSHTSQPGDDPEISTPASYPGESAGKPQRTATPANAGDTDRSRDRKTSGHQDCCDDHSGKGKDHQDCCDDHSGKGKDHEDCCDGHSGKDKDHQDCCDDHSGKGNERSNEMLDRRDERKQEKAAYKSDRMPGQEGKSAKNK